MRNPIERLGLPHAWTVALDWIVTIVGAVAIVLAIKAWVVNPYRIPTSSMEPRLHCARAGPGCLARFSDRVLANRFIYHLQDPKRGDIVVFNTPMAAEEHCPPAGTFVKRIIGLPGETWEQRRGGRLHQQPTPDRALHPPRSAGLRHLSEAQDSRGLVLRDGRQPDAIVRFAGLGRGPEGEPDRQGVRDLLAAEPDFLPLTSSLGPFRPSLL